MKKYTITNERPLSWSAISSFEYNPEQWYQKYYLGIEQRKTPELEFGSMVGKKLETDPTFLPTIARQSTMEHKFLAITHLTKIPIIGFADSFCGSTFCALEEYKTGKKSWSQKRADQHGQITMYLLMNYLMNGIKPEQVACRIWWMPTWKNGDKILFLEPIEKRIKCFETKRTMQDILKFEQRIKDVYTAMQEYVKSYPQ